MARASFTITAAILCGFACAPNHVHIQELGPRPTVRSIGRAGVLGTTSASGQAGATTVTVSSVPAAVGPGDRLSWGDTEHFIVEVRGPQTLVIAPALPQPIAGQWVTVERAFATLQAWEDARDGDLVGEERSEVGLLYADAVFEGSLGRIRFGGSSTDADHRMELVAAPGSDHAGVPGAGVVLDASGSEFILINIETDFVRIAGFEIRNFGQDPAAGGEAAIRIKATDVVLERLLIHDEVTSGASAVRSSIDDVAVSATVEGCMFWNVTRGVLTDTATAELTVLSTTVFNAGDTGILARSGTITATNVIAVGSQTGDFGGNVVGRNNLSSDGSGPGPGSVTGVATGLFLSADTTQPNLHIQRGSAADGSGTATELEVDIDGETRPQGAWDIGADEI